MEGGIRETRRSNLHHNYNHKPLVLLAGVLAVIAILLFASHRYYSLAKAIDGSLWGEFGDFIGGVVGTIIAYISIRLLIDTLGAQNKANQIASETAKDNDYTYRLQQLNDHYQMLLKLYRETLSQFKKTNKKDGKTGQAYLHDAMLEMRVKMINNQTTFANRNSEAISLFSSFYTEHRDVASVYFRIIYRLWGLIFDTKLYLRDKLRYAKILRCQLSEAELFMLRYNAYTSNGKKMQKYINQFNVTKHLPELSLLEFSYWRDSKFRDDAARNLLITYFIALRKSIKSRIVYEDVCELEQIGGNYEINDEIEEKKYTLRIKRSNDTVNEEGTVAAVFDRLSVLELRDLMDDFITELFVYRSFKLYQASGDVTIHKLPEDNNADTVVIIVEGIKPLELYKNEDIFVLDDNDDEQDEPINDNQTFEESL